MNGLKDSQNYLMSVFNDWINSYSKSITDLLTNFYAVKPGSKLFQDDYLSALSNSQKAVNKMLEVSKDLWDRGVSTEHDVEDIASQLSKLVEQWFTGTNSTQFFPFAGAENPANLWTNFVTQLPLAAPGSDLFSKLAQSFTKDGFGSGLAAQDSLDPLTSLAENIAQLPRVGSADAAESRELLQGFALWVAYMRAEQKHQLARLEAFQDIVKQGVSKLKDYSKTGKTIKSARELLMFWIAAGDDVFMEMYRDNDYQKIQRELMEASLNYKKWLEHFRSSFYAKNGLVTHQEMDDTYRAIYELKKELRALKRELRQKPKPRARTSRKVAEKI